MPAWAAGDRAAAGSIVSWTANGLTRLSRPSMARASCSSSQVASCAEAMAAQTPIRMICRPRRTHRPDAWTPLPATPSPSPPHGSSRGSSQPDGPDGS